MWLELYSKSEVGGRAQLNGMLEWQKTSNEMNSWRLGGWMLASVRMHAGARANVRASECVRVDVRVDT